MPDLARILIVLGAFFVFVGLFLLLAGKFFPSGRLPGDIFFQKGDFSFYFPLTTSVLVSIILSVVLILCSRK